MENLLKQTMVSFMERSAGNWCIKDINSNYIFINSNGINYYCFDNIDFQGKSDKEIQIDRCQELWPEFIAHDRKVIEEKRRISAIEIHKYNSKSSENLSANYCEKTPLYDEENKVIGIISYGIELDNPALLYYMNLFNRKTIQFDAPNNLFSKRELEIAFWAQQKLSAKEISKRLDISHRTVENRLQGMYEKAGVHNSTQFIEYCKTTGLDQYIPLDFIRKGVHRID